MSSKNDYYPLMEDIRAREIVAALVLDYDNARVLHDEMVERLTELMKQAYLHELGGSS